jgi:hypothetical protein
VEVKTGEEDEVSNDCLLIVVIVVQVLTQRLAWLFVGGVAQRSFKIVCLWREHVECWNWQQNLE